MLHSDTYSLIIPGVISAISSFSILFTCLFLFPEFRKLRYIELVLYVSINDFIASIAMSLGPSDDGSATCWFQGLSSNFNFVSAVLWATVIAYQVYLIVLHGTVLTDLTFLHYVCWGIPFVMSLLPLSTDTYGTYNDENWCFIRSLSNSNHTWTELFWVILSFYVWIWMAIIINFVFIVSILRKLYKMQEIPQIIWDSFTKLSLYPIIISICWVPSSLTDMFKYTQGLPDTDEWNGLSYFATVLSISQGFFFACVFFTMNPIVKYRFQILFTEYGIFGFKSEEKTNRPLSVEMQSKLEEEIDHVLTRSRNNSQISQNISFDSSTTSNNNPILVSYVRSSS